jgi:hypothetical protein
MWTKKKRRKEKKVSKIKEYTYKDKHHRHPRSLGGDDSDRNLSVVTQHLHRAYHLLFSNGTPYDIASILNAVWISPNYELIARRRNESNDT